MKPKACDYSTKCSSKKTFDETIASIHVVFAEAAQRKKDYNSALEHLQAALDSIPSYKKGPKALYRQEILGRIDQVIKLKAGH